MSTVLPYTRNVPRESPISLREYNDPTSERRNLLRVIFLSDFDGYDIRCRRSLLDCP